MASRTVRKTLNAPSFIYWACAVYFIEAGLEIRPAVFPSHLDGGSHIVSQDEEL